MSREDKMGNETTAASGGIGCGSLLAVGLTILFVGLKLTEHIAWSWLWVLSPLWILALVTLVFIVIALAIFLVVIIFKD
jgi:hypothetical protein